MLPSWCQEKLPEMSLSGITESLELLAKKFENFCSGISLNFKFAQVVEKKKFVDERKNKCEERKINSSVFLEN
jgi:hypothetical protein